MLRSRSPSSGRARSARPRPAAGRRRGRPPWRWRRTRRPTPPRRPPAPRSAAARPRASHRRIALVQRRLGAQAIRDVGEDHAGAAALRHLDRHRDIGDGKRRAVAPEEPIQIARDRPAGGSRELHRALGGAIGRPVRVFGVDRLVTVAPEQLVRAVIAKRRDRRGADEPDHVVGINHPHRRRGRLAHGGEQILGTDPQASQIDQGMRWHAKPPGTSESTCAPPSLRTRVTHKCRSGPNRSRHRIAATNNAATAPFASG